MKAIGSPTNAPTAAAPTLSPKSRLAERLRESLRAEILQGRWKNDLPPERNLAAELQVSRPNVHLALRSLEREGLVQLMPQRPWKIVAHSESRGSFPRRPEVTVLLPTRIRFDLTAQSPWLDPLRHKFHALGLDVSIRDPFANEMKDVDRTLKEFDAKHRSSFYVLASVLPVVQRWFQAHHIPALIFGSRAPDVQLPTVEIDHDTPVRHAVEYLLRRGHRRVALLNLPTPSGGTIVANEAFLRACRDWRNGNVEPIIQTALSRPLSVEAAIHREFARGRPPTAFVTIDLEMTISLYTILGQIGLRIPRDVSVLCCYYWPTLDFLCPRPTCYTFSWETVANRMARIVRNYLHLRCLPNTVTKTIHSLREGLSVSSPPSTELRR